MKQWVFHGSTSSVPQKFLSLPKMGILKCLEGFGWFQGSQNGVVSPQLAWSKAAQKRPDGEHTLQKACEKFIDMCLEAGYKEHMYTKFHWVLHFPQHLAKHKMLPSCFVQERKHKMIKRPWVLNGRQTPVSAFQSRWPVYFPELANKLCKQDCRPGNMVAYELANDPAMPMDLEPVAVEQKLEELRKTESEWVATQKGLTVQSEWRSGFASLEACAASSGSNHIAEGT